MLAHISALIPLVILGIQDRWWILGAVVVVALLVIAYAISTRSRGPKLDIRQLPAEHAARYLAEMDAAEATFVDNPQQAAARARGLVEEVLRRKGFPDRIDNEQRLRDLARHDRTAADGLKTAYAAMKNHADTENLRRALRSYRDVLKRLLRDEAPQQQGGGSISPEVTVG